MKIAVSGKGGAGKTTVAAGLAYLLARDGFTVYAVDADPDATLGLTLGFTPAELAKLTPLVEMKEVIEEKSGGGGAYYNLNPDVEDVIADYSLRRDNIRLMLMGGIKQGGSACYCRENSFLNAVLNTLLDKQEAVILDTSAGIEHLTRGTAQGVDLIIVVTEPTRAGVKTAGLVCKLARELGIAGIKILGNKIRREEEKEYIRQHLPGETIAGFLPYVDKVWERSMEDHLAGFSADDLLAGLDEVYNNILKEEITREK
ncbi:MAG: AAA family ATPase [Bacillota bacterium]